MKKEKIKKCLICRQKTNHTNNLGFNWFVHIIIGMFFFPWVFVGAFLLLVESQNWKCEKCKKTIY